jgi:hypothetical protein
MYINLLKGRLRKRRLYRLNYERMLNWDITIIEMNTGTPPPHPDYRAILKLHRPFRDRRLVQQMAPFAQEIFQAAGAARCIAAKTCRGLYGFDTNIVLIGNSCAVGLTMPDATINRVGGYRSPI